MLYLVWRRYAERQQYLSPIGLVNDLTGSPLSSKLSDFLHMAASENMEATDYFLHRFSHITPLSATDMPDDMSCTDR
jgi:hypothetical protein